MILRYIMWIVICLTLLQDTLSDQRQYRCGRMGEFCGNNAICSGRGFERQCKCRKYYFGDPIEGCFLRRYEYDGPEYNRPSSALSEEEKKPIYKRKETQGEEEKGGWRKEKERMRMEDKETTDKGEIKMETNGEMKEEGEDKSESKGTTKNENNFELDIGELCWRTICAGNATCHLAGKQPVCVCDIGFKGNPYQNCEPYKLYL